MSRLPVIVAAGGVNSAGRISGHHAYRRIVFEAQPKKVQDQTLKSLASLMNIKQEGAKLSADQQQFILDRTLIRCIEANRFTCEGLPIQTKCTVNQQEGDNAIEITISKKNLPDPMPTTWSVKRMEGNLAIVQINSSLECLLAQQAPARVKSAGQLPTGFDPTTLYPARNHPKGLSLAIYASSDAVGDLGIDLNNIRQLLSPEQISVYAGSSLGQLDCNGFGGLFSAPREGRRVTSKQLPLGLPEMPVDFVNAYVLGNVGTTGCNIGACATFLYNLSLGMHDIQEGRCRMSFIGSAEAPLTSDIIEGFRAMGALAEDKMLMALDQNRTSPDYRRACRPFGNNCGFTLAESGIFLVLMDDGLALETGARILGGVASTHVSSDGFKKSISGPGVGNYATMGLSLATAKSILNEDELKHRTYIQAHGTGTPQNRVTESRIMSELAGVFKLEGWLVSAIKSYIGHSLAPAAADQIIACLGTWQDGVIPGILTIDQVADDVYTKNLHYPTKHQQREPDYYQGAFINSKGFGGNNATAFLLSPDKVKAMMMHKHGQKAWHQYQKKQAVTAEKSIQYDADNLAGKTSPSYYFGKGVLDGADLQIDTKGIKLPNFDKAISLDIKNPYSDMC